MFQNTQERLLESVDRARHQRARRGLEGLVGDVAAVIINTEPARFVPAVAYFLRYTRLDVAEAFACDGEPTCVLRTAGSIDIILTSRRGGGIAGQLEFAGLNDYPRARELPGTRLETIVFETADLERYVAIQRQRGVRFLGDGIQDEGPHAFIQTAPSAHTGNCIALVQWADGRRWAPDRAAPLNGLPAKPHRPWQANIGAVDHMATRLHAEGRDPAVVELMELTGYDFDRAFYVPELNSITNVTRGRPSSPAIVFTTGIAPYVDERSSGPTEKFVHQYGPRMHHLAFHTEPIEPTVEALKADGMEFLLPLVGTESEGIKQIFSAPAPDTLLVHEYMLRYNGVSGFFTQGNVRELTRATGKQ